MMKSPVLSLAVILLFCQAVSAAPGSIATEDVTASVSLENFPGALREPRKPSLSVRCPYAKRDAAAL